jgi:hypothetical protein
MAVIHLLSLIGITYGSIHYILYIGNFGTEKKMSNGHNVYHFKIPTDNVNNLENKNSSLFEWQFEKGKLEGYWR